MRFIGLISCVAATVLLSGCGSVEPERAQGAPSAELAGVPKVDRVLSTFGGQTTFFASAESGSRTVGLVLAYEAGDVSTISFDLPVSDQYAPSAIEVDGEGWYVLAPGCFEESKPCEDGTVNILSVSNGRETADLLAAFDPSGEAELVGAVGEQLVVSVLGDHGSRIVLVNSMTGDVQELEWRPPIYSSSEIRAKANEAESSDKFDIPRTSYCVAPTKVWVLTAPAVIEGNQQGDDSLTSIELLDDRRATSVSIGESVQRSAASLACDDSGLSTVGRSGGTVTQYRIDLSGLVSGKALYRKSVLDDELVVYSAAQGGVFSDLVAPIASAGIPGDFDEGVGAAPELPTGRVIVTGRDGSVSEVKRGVAQTGRVALSQDAALVFVASSDGFTIREVK